MANAASLPTQPFRLATGSQPARNFGLSFKRLRTPSMTGPFWPSIHRMVTIPILATLARPSWVQSKRILCNSLQPLLGDEREQLAHRAFEGKFERSPFIWFALTAKVSGDGRPDRRPVSFLVRTRSVNQVAAGAGQGSNSPAIRSEPPKDRLSKSLNRQNAECFGWQAWRAARARCPRFACHACPLAARFSAA